MHMSEELKAIEPNNPGFDTAEVNAKAVAIFLVVTVVMLIVVIGGVQYYFDSVHEQEVYQKIEVPVSDDLRDLRAREDGQLGSYAYVNREAGTVRLPISRAMEILAAEAAEGKLPYATQDQKVKKEAVQVASNERK
jgi:hypothetical protein